MSELFSVETTGKCILAGEHSVLRHHPALVFPVFERRMKFSFYPGTEPLHAEFSGEDHERVHLVFWAVLERALALLEQPRHTLRGKIHIENTLPVGSGLGASAALCVALARWCSHFGWCADEEIYSFARSLEDLFHHKAAAWILPW